MERNMLKKNCFILFSNMKGGTGKTTLCELFATYAVEKGLPIIVFDADVQLSLFQDRRDDLVRYPDAKTLWDVQPLVVDDSIADKIKVLKAVPGIVLIDCPGNIDNANLQPLFQAADIIVVPYRYDRKNVRETKTFLDMLLKIGVSARMLLIPNMVKYIEFLRVDFHEQQMSLKAFCDGTNSTKHLLYEIWDRTELRAANTIALNSKQRCEVRDSFDQIISEINAKQKSDYGKE